MGEGAPILAHSLVVADGAAPTRLMLFLHGLFGRGGNLRTVARGFVEARPQWGAVLVDLRLHGGSQGFPPPHTVEEAARDLERLRDHLALPVRGVAGHSLGGKTALIHFARTGGTLDHAFVIDAQPGARPGRDGPHTTLGVFDWLSSLPRRLPSRDAFVALAVAAGHDRALALWLAANWQRTGEEYSLVLDLPSLRQAVDSYFAAELWPLLEAPPGRGKIHVIVGARSPVFWADDRERLHRAVAAGGGRVTAHELDTSHWVHSEDPAGVIRLLAGAVGGED